MFAVLPGLDAIAEGVVRAEQARLRSVLVRTNDVLASNSHGLFRARRSDKKWAALPIPPSMPPGGLFAQQPCGATPIFYYTPKWRARKLPHAEKKVFGLYVSEDDGQRWQLISKDYDFKEVFLHSDGTLYAIVAMTEEIAPTKAKQAHGVWISDQENEKGNRTIHFDRIVMSVDSGRSWRDISSGIARSMTLYSIFSDPDHSELVCLGGNCIRGYVLQATDKSYKWKKTRERDWWKTHETEDTFFRGCYSTGSTLYMCSATLSNYFDHPFHNRVHLPAFRITTARNSYRFRAEDQVAVQVEVSFIREQPEVKILDLDEGLGFWGMRCILPDGKKQTISTSIGHSIYKSRSREKTKAELRRSPTLKARTINMTRSYKRSLNLSSLCDFPQIGTYRVQLFYNSGWIADRTEGEWPGSFCSSVFTITIDK